MRLRNKKTGEILDDFQYRNYSLSDGFGFRMNGKEWEYHSLAELNAEWEDAPEEPKEYWFIDEEGDISSFDYVGNAYDKKMQAIGNFFETEEQAKKAVEKLEAFKRLKDKGFRFKGWDWEDDPSKIEIKFRCPDESCLSLFDIQDDLDLLFLGGGE